VFRPFDPVPLRFRPQQPSHGLRRRRIGLSDAWDIHFPRFGTTRRSTPRSAAVTHNGITVGDTVRFKDVPVNFKVVGFSERGRGAGWGEMERDALNGVLF